MAEITVEVQSRITGADLKHGDIGSVLVRIFEESITVEELIRRTVHEQIKDLITKRRMNSEKAREILARQYLTTEETAEQAKDGAIRFPSSRRTRVPDIDVEAETQNALRAFEARRYYILVDGRQMERLTEEITFSPGAKITFLRLMPLKGG